MGKRLRRELYQNLFDAILKMSTDGFVVTDRFGIVTDISENYAAFLHLPPEAAIGKPIGELVPVSEMMNVMQQNRIDRDCIQSPLSSNVTAESKNHLLITSRAPISDDDGKIVGAVAQMKFHEQIGKDYEQVEKLYSKLNAYSDKAYQLALEQFSVANYKTILDRQNLLLQYYQQAVNQLSMLPNHMMIGSSPAFLRVKDKALRVAKNAFSTLITGETGTGKELLADLIHGNSNRKDQPFIKINCAAIPYELLESELFGYKAGAFTGAKKEGKKGKFELANHGSIFLDEIGDMPLNMQTKLLRVLQEKEIEPLGGTKPIKIDVRVISATRRNITEMIKKGEFREDLYYRLSEVQIHMPTLAERQEDIIPLANHVLGEINKKYKTNVVIAEEVLPALQKYHWPGNIRELNNVIKGAYSVVDQNQITLYNIPTHISSVLEKPERPDQHTLKSNLEWYEKRLIINCLLETGCDLSEASKRLGIHRSNLYKRLTKYDIDLAAMRAQLAAGTKRKSHEKSFS